MDSNLFLVLVQLKTNRRIFLTSIKSTKKSTIRRYRPPPPAPPQEKTCHMCYVHIIPEIPALKSSSGTSSFSIHLNSKSCPGLSSKLAVDTALTILSFDMPTVAIACTWEGRRRAGKDRGQVGGGGGEGTYSSFGYCTC